MMPIRTIDLEQAESRRYLTRVREFESAKYTKKTAFLCHSHKDEVLAKGLQVLLAEQGLVLYIDWQDATMPETPNRETARKIKEKIGELNLFLFLATENSCASRWCPWEIGIADMMKGYDKIIIIPTLDISGIWHGNEYLQLYDQITTAEDGKLAWFPADKGKQALYIKDLQVRA